jgi:hypothetical protein
MYKTGHVFEYFRNKFPNESDAKIKEGIFIGPQIRELMHAKEFDEDLNETERNVWLNFKRICTGLPRKSQSNELSGCCEGPADFVQSYGMQCESENPLFLVPFVIFPRKPRRNQ